jgi:UDP-2,4-diacetamido-2,4,6-trideoxy-beta-L-altropyranose hydrolase
LARALRALGAECLFLCRSLEGNISPEIAADGFEVFGVPGSMSDASADAAAIGFDADYSATAPLLTAIRPDCLIVDHYDLDAEWERQALRLVDRCVAIDDLARRHADIDLLVDTTPGHDRLKLYDNVLPGSALVFLGPRYALLREEFAARRASIGPRSGKIGRCLVNFGGTHAVALCADALRAIQAALGDTVAIDVVVPASSTELQQLGAGAIGDVKFIGHATPAQMAELMANADIAIGAAGTTSWERACLGLPAIVTAIADNQVAVVTAIVNAGAALEVPVGREYVQELSHVLHGLAANPEQAQRMSRNAFALIDGRGAERVARFIVRPAIHLRRAEAADRASIWAWRNEPHVRAVSFNQAPISWESHTGWYDSVLQSAERHLLVCETAGESVGVVRFDLSGDEAVISVYLNAVGRGKGIGAELLRGAEKWLLRQHPHLHRIVAEIMDANLASIAAFEAARYHPRAGKYVREITHHESA